MAEKSRNNQSTSNLKSKESHPGISTSSRMTRRKDSLSAHQLNISEKSADNKDLGGFYNPRGSNESRLSKIRTSAIGKRKGLLLGAGGGVGIIVAIIIGFFALIPLKIESIIENLENHFGSTTQNAI